MVLTQDSKNALEFLRAANRGQWSITPLFVLVIYVIFGYIGEQKWDHLLGMLAFFGMDFFNELVNSGILHYTNYSALWTTSVENTTYIPLVGWNIEIMLTFLIAPLVAFKITPKIPTKYKIPTVLFWVVFGFFVIYPETVIVLDFVVSYSFTLSQLLFSILFAFLLIGIFFLKFSRYVEIPSIIVLSFFFSCIAVGFELFLNYTGLLLWTYKYWNFYFPFLIIFFGYFHFFYAAIWVFQRQSRLPQFIAVGLIYLINFVVMIFLIYQKWI
ncbi:hypothetical protein M0811_05540 [Anaeramoeba ignava]|uniref:Uncharacterized protein n=1 Tax=Anaeramoeba ignava TaxID=1746090 RepID=A0A9Q0LTX5_ANAIG|nr:hypothetical protein M0811_05540 [Anaeramoeba ignava]